MLLPEGVVLGRSAPLFGQFLQGRQGGLISQPGQVPGHGDLGLIRPGIEQLQQSLHVRFREKLPRDDLFLLLNVRPWDGQRSRYGAHTL